MLAAHPITSIHCAKDVARQLSFPFNVTHDLPHRLEVSLFDGSLGHRAEGLPRRHTVAVFLLGLEHFTDRVERTWTVIPDQHRCAPAVVLREHLRAAATSTVAIEITDHLIAQVFVAESVTWLNSVTTVALLARLVKSL